ncbi:MAG: hypothetical protein ACYCPQ_03570 [Elusimicrobiota bacterium]
MRGKTVFQVASRALFFSAAAWGVIKIISVGQESSIPRIYPVTHDALISITAIRASPPAAFVLPRSPERFISRKHHALAKRNHLLPAVPNRRRALLSPSNEDGRFAPHDDERNDWKFSTLSRQGRTASTKRREPARRFSLDEYSRSRVRNHRTPRRSFRVRRSPTRDSRRKARKRGVSPRQARIRKRSRISRSAAGRRKRFSAFAGRKSRRGSAKVSQNRQRREKNKKKEHDRDFSSLRSRRAKKRSRRSRKRAKRGPKKKFKKGRSRRSKRAAKKKSARKTSGRALLAGLIGRGALKPPKSSVAAPKSSNPWSQPLPSAIPNGGRIKSGGLKDAQVEFVEPPDPKTKRRLNQKGWFEDGQTLYYRRQGTWGRLNQGAWSWMRHENGHWWLWSAPSRPPLLWEKHHWWIQNAGRWFLVHNGEPWGYRYLNSWGGEGFENADGAKIIYSKDGRRIAVSIPKKGAAVFDADTGEELGNWDAKLFPDKPAAHIPSPSSIVFD